MGFGVDRSTVREWRNSALAALCVPIGARARPPTRHTPEKPALDSSMDETQDPGSARTRTIDVEIEDGP